VIPSDTPRIKLTEAARVGNQLMMTEGLELLLPTVLTVRPAKGPLEKTLTVRRLPMSGSLKLIGRLRIGSSHFKSMLLFAGRLVAVGGWLQGPGDVKVNPTALPIVPSNALMDNLAVDAIVGIQLMIAVGLGLLLLMIWAVKPGNGFDRIRYTVTLSPTSGSLKPIVRLEIDSPHVKSTR
jgi:hypothetical protein